MVNSLMDRVDQGAVLFNFGTVTGLQSERESERDAERGFRGSCYASACACVCSGDFFF